jgi:hypothetical protein
MDNGPMVNEREDAMNKSRIDIENDRAGNEPEPRDDGLTHEDICEIEDEMRRVLLDIYRTATGKP